MILGMFIIYIDIICNVCLICVGILCYNCFFVDFALCLCLCLCLCWQLCWHNCHSRIIWACSCITFVCFLLAWFPCVWASFLCLFFLCVYVMCIKLSFFPLLFVSYFVYKLNQTKTRHTKKTKKLWGVCIDISAQNTKQCECPKKHKNQA